ncbi:hypothetical protein A1D17_03405 [Pseudomonas fluorescens]|uniref:Uncharacterized protein n=1 Tax=Pseudomonas fluorescens TaxID=294 RepID=A0A166QNQ2_PSEFL|nr:hypothetical protein A1D17_03405 [Pseudomonas fluorescens]
MLGACLGLLGSFIGGESAVKGVPGFILGSGGASRARERTQSTQITKINAVGDKPARFPPKISELSKKFEEDLKKAVQRREDTLLQLIDDTANLRSRAEDAAASLQSAIGLFPVVAQELRHTISLRSKEWPGAPGNIYLALRSKGGGRDSLCSLTENDSTQASQLLHEILGQEGAEQVLVALKKVRAVTDEMKRLAALSVAFPNELKVGGVSILSSWVEGAGTYGSLCAVALATKVRSFEMIDGELNDHVFEFNAKRQPVRYRSIICRPDLSEDDPLGPTEPRFRVVSYISKRTGKRNSTPVKEYKAKMAKQQAIHDFTRTLGAELSPDAIKKAVNDRVKRACSPWITTKLISHCYLGKHTAVIMDKQKLIAGAMEQWLSLRQLFQHLLHK